ncbi:hypothetical protein [Gelidibacter algens]|uniref:hypothetical protein n=1 Tax=Gelidibacter algens TaxID=49280 RepID=UPI000AC9DDB3|nr:hypothetical protein [Gelidibacter algens]
MLSVYTLLLTASSTINYKDALEKGSSFSSIVKTNSPKFFYHTSNKKALTYEEGTNELNKGYKAHNPSLNSSYISAVPYLQNNSSGFSWEILETTYPVSDSVVKNRDLAASSFKAIEASDSWIDKFTNEDIQELPIGIKHTNKGGNNDNVEYAIGITNATFNKDYTELTVFARVRLPQTDNNGTLIELFFGANNVKLSHQGGIVGDANLVLLGDVHIPFNAGKWMLSLKGGFDYKTGNVQNRTYVTINCDGVKELGVNGIVEFSRELIIPIESNGEVNESKTLVNEIIETESGSQTIQVPYRVKGEFYVVASSWNDLLVDIDLQPFVLAKKRNNKDYYGNFQFFVNHAVLDFSDIRNDPAAVFPVYYHENGLLLPNERSWRGVYVNTVEVKMPTEFKTSETISKGSNERVAFGAHHLIIDNYGVSGTFYGDNVFTLEQGRTNDNKAWMYSLDHIEVTLAANNLIGARIDGRILLPVSENKKTTNSSPERIGLRYSGLILPDEYLLHVSTDSIIDFNLWKGKGQLFPNSSIELAVREGEFKPKATLHGRLAITANQIKSLEDEDEEIEITEIDENGNPKKQFIDFKGIEFQNLVLQTESPIFKVGYMGYEDEATLGGFPVSISRIGITSNETNANLYFDLAINLMGENNGFAAKTSLAIIGKFEEENYRQKFKLDGIELDAIAINADLGGFQIWGSLLLMNNDPVYGNGFQATLGAEFKKIGKLEVNAIFGKSDFRYWMVDGLVDFPPGTGSGINLSGFAGGASYKMRRQDFGSAINGGAFTYAPDKNSGLGVKAMVLLNAVDDAVLKGGAGFEILFNTKGGLNQLSLYGQGAIMNVKVPGMGKISDLYEKIKNETDKAQNFLGKTKSEEEQSWAGRNLLDKSKNEFPKVDPELMTISGMLGITMDFQNDELHGELDVSVSVPGGFVHGGGKAVIHIAPEKWYFYIGTPEHRMNLKIGVGPLKVETGGYFMIGSVLPDSPPPPIEVADILGVDANELNYMRDQNALKSGRGFAFGTDFKVDTGDLRFLIFYANFKAGAGFDIMLRDYGDVQCSNTGDQVGINGWYANGQAYAYLQGELGIQVKLFFIKKKIPIIKGGAAVLLQAKAPNPIWMRGYVGGNFNVLGGLVKGKFRFKITIGEECEFENASPLGGLKMIADLTPSNGSDTIDVFTIPQATFNMKVGQALIIPEDDGDKTYRIDLDKFVLLHNGKEIPGKLEWSASNDRVNLVSSDILSPNEKLTVRVEVSFKEKVNGVFQPIMVDGKPAKETEERTFTTGGAPDYIPLHNITYAYPVVDQKYFMEDESNTGYIQLKRGQDYLFDDKAWESFIRYSKMNDTSSEPIDFKYNTTENRLTYAIPNVSQQSSYTMLIASKPKGASTSTHANSSKNKKEKNNDGGGSYARGIEKEEVNIKQNKADHISKNGEIERLAYKFGSSKYKTLKQKINSISTQNYNWGVIYSDVIYLTNTITDHEPFDSAELLGSGYTNNVPLISVEATLDDAYFISDMNPPLYSKYPLGGKYQFDNRDGQTLGTPPKYALPIVSEYLTNLEYGVNEQMLRTTFPFHYNLGLVYKEDWVDMHSQIVNDQIDGLLPRGSAILNFLDADYVFMRYGFYKTTLSYNLPGDINGTSTTYKFKNPNKFR